MATRLEAPGSGRHRSAATPGDRSGGLPVRRPRAVLLGALLLLLVSAGVGATVTGALVSGGMVDPGAPSTQANFLLETEFPAGRPNLLLLVEVPGSVDDPAVRQAGEQVAAGLGGIEGIAAVRSYWTGDERLRSADGRRALITAVSQVDPVVVAEETEPLADRVAAAVPGASLKVGGAAQIDQEIQERTDSDLARTELIALPITFLVLLVVFGSLVAALLPLALGLFSILTTLLVLRIVTIFTPVSIFSLNLCTALGLGLAIDYSLLMVRRHREELAAGLDPRAAVAATLRTAGRTVLFSSVTVALALCAMLAFPQYFLRSFAYAGIAVVLLTGVAAVTVLPALLVVLGHRVDSLDVTRRWRRGPRRDPSGWRRLGAVLVRRPLPIASACLVLLVLLGLPFLGLRSGKADDRQLPADSAASQVQQALRTDFPGSTGRVEVVLTGLADPAATGDYAARLSSVPGIAEVTGPTGRYAGGSQVEAGAADGGGFVAGTTGWLTLAGDQDPNSTAARDTVAAVRAVPAPAGATVFVGGPAAELVDTEAAIARGLPWAALIIVVTTLVLLFLLTGGILVSVKALVLNLLSLTATFGAIVWVFQEGHLRGLLGGFQVTGYVDTNVLVLVFCVAFGLSMDYEVFLLSRIREEHRRTGRTPEAIVAGLERTGGVITAAAVLISAVLVGLAASSVVDLKLVGVGLTLAIVVDATVVRCLLAPSVMRLAGEANWWAPAPLRRLSDRVGLRD